MRARALLTYTAFMCTEASESVDGLLLVVSGPSGVGKTTITREVLHRLKGVFSVSATTRPRTDSEADGRDYHFVSVERFREMVAQGKFLESAEVYGSHCYGTPREPIEKELAAGRLVVLDVDVQGAQQVKQVMPEALAVFIFPPSDDELQRRLHDRRREDEASIQRRFKQAKEEIDFANESDVYDVRIVNDDLQAAIDELCRAVRDRRGES